MSRRPRVLVVARNYPNPSFPTLGLWAERLVAVGSRIADCRVVAAVPWAPPVGPAQSARFRSVPREEETPCGRVYHPRMFTLPGHYFHGWDARLQYTGLRRCVDRIRRSWPFDLIHAHLIYPDGVMAERLGRRYGVPVVTTEHALWQPWLEAWPSVRRQVLAAAPGIARVTSVSQAVDDSVRATTGEVFETSILHNVVDDSVFVAPGPDDVQDPDQILFVGAVRHVKGLDVLVRAMALLAEELPRLHLRVLGEAFYGQWRKDEQEVRGLCETLGVASRVEFAGRATAEEVARAMRSSAMLVVPARRESFSAVAVEALASGTPVVATRCGGPEEFISDDNGRLVPTEDPAALADAIRDVRASLASFDRLALRRYAVDRFGADAIQRAMEEVYGHVLGKTEPPGARDATLET